jgi:hypothetical protein
MKAILIILMFLISLTFLSCGQESKSNQPSFILKTFDAIDTNDFAIKNFKALPKVYANHDRAYLIDKISPTIKYVYWECVFKDALSDNSRGRIIVYNGDSLNYS